jgi:RNA polymerase sigma-70 factor (ECF subfamily)
VTAHDDDHRLARAALARDAGAERALHDRIRRAAASASRRLGGDAAFTDEIAQRVAERLWLGRGGGAPALAGYTGEAPLGAWLRVIAYREAIDLRRGDSAPAGDDALVDRVVGAAEPELAMLRRGYQAVFRACFAQALGGLSLHDRDLLRRHHLDGLTIDVLATLHGVHRATAARWLAQVRERLVAATRDALARELAGEVDLPEVLAMIASQLEASLSRQLRS